MALSILGFVIGGVFAAVLLIVGVIGLFMKGSFGQSVRGILSMIPLGNARLWAIIFLALGIFAGGWGVIYGAIAPLTSSISTGSLATSDGVTSALTGVECRFNTPTEVTATDNVTFRADQNSLNRYYADVKYDSGAASINGTLSCTRAGDIEQAARMTVFVKADSFRSETSTTDSNTYYILATSATASKVPGFPWAQTAYVNDGAVATTSSDQEMTEIVFVGGSSAQAKETVGYYVTLPGATVFGYLNNQTSNDVHIKGIVNGVEQELATLTITKTTA